MKKAFVYLAALMLTACGIGKQQCDKGFVTIQGHDLVKPNGEKLLIQGTNLGNWLNPEGYMFGFGRTNSAWMIDLMMKEAVGPDATAAFWQQYKDKLFENQATWYYMEGDELRNYLGDLERGVRNPTLIILNKIAKALEIDLAVLFEGIKEL